MRCYNPTKLMKQLKLCAILGAAAGACLPMTAAAQGDAILEEITVTATRREQSLQDVPVSVAIMSGEKLNSLFSGSEDVLALAGRVPGLYAESSNGRAAPRFYVRGLGNIDFDLGASQPVSFIMDEVVMENVVLKSFPLFDVNNIEVMRGPQGTLFGRNTTAGIIKVNTVRPEQESTGYIRSSVGTHSTFNLEGAAGGAITDTLSIRGSGILRRRSNWISNGSSGEKDTMGKFADIAGRVQLLWEPSDTFSGLLSFQARQLDGTSSIFRANVFTTGSNSLNQNYTRDVVYYDDGDNNPQGYKNQGTTLNLQWDWSSTSLTSITSYQSADGSSRGDIDAGTVDFSQSNTVPPGITSDPNVLVFGFIPALTYPGTIATPSVTEDGADTSQLTQEFRLASNSDDSFRWQTGVFYFDSTLEVQTDSFMSFGASSTRNTIVQYDNTAWALFGQIEYDFTDSWTGAAGVRYTNDDKKFKVNQYGAGWTDPPFGPPLPLVPPIDVSDDNVSADLSLNWAMSDSASIYGRLSTGFRAQTIQGRDVAFGQFPTVAKPETIQSIEFGYKGDLLNDRLRINTAVFYYEVDDMQLSVIGGAANINAVINADKGTASGIELDSQYLITENLEVTLGFSFTDTEIDDPNLTSNTCGSGLCTPTDPPVDPNDPTQGVRLNGNPFPRVPDSSFTFTLRYGVPRDNGEFFFFTDWNYNGTINMPLYEAVEFVTDGQYEGGLRLGYMSYNGWEVALFGRNITDETNVLGFVDFSNNTGFVNTPRIWGLEASYAYGN